MNNSISGWNFESDTCITNQKKPTWNDQGIVELLWQNGQVVMHNQSYRKPAGNNSSDLRSSGLYRNSSKFSQEDVTVPWIQYQPEDLLEQELCSNLLSELPPCEVESYKPIRQLEEGNFVNSVASSAPYASSSSQGSPMPALRFHAIDSSQKINDFGGSKKIIIVSSAPASAQPREKHSANMSQSEAKECSVMTVGSSHCGRNHILQDPDLSKASSNGVWDTTLSSEPEAIRDCVQRTISGSDKGKSEMVEPTMTSSSGGSGSSIGRTCSLSTRSHGQKRKGTDAEASEEQSEATELKSADGNSDKASQRVGSSKRSRAAEVHNLSERRRRERINEKMRALQKLIPNSNKTDKASMLEEAIEYLKSLQLQLQLMWMGAGMTPMMFPGIQHYMSQMSMGLAPSSLPSIHNPIQLPRVTHDQSISMVQMPNQAVLCQNPVLGAFNYQNQMQNHCLSEQYARCMGYLMQSASQPVNNVFGYGSQAAQLSQTMVAPSNSSGPMTMSGWAANIDDGERGKMGSTFN